MSADRLSRMELDGLREGVSRHLVRTSNELQDKLGMDFSVSSDDGGFEELLSTMRSRGGLNELAELANMGIDDVGELFDNVEKGDGDGDGDEIDRDLLLSRLRDIPEARDAVDLLELMQIATVLLIFAHALKEGYVLEVSKEVLRYWQVRKEIGEMLD